MRLKIEVQVFIVKKRSLLSYYARCEIEAKIFIVKKDRY